MLIKKCLVINCIIQCFKFVSGITSKITVYNGLYLVTISNFYVGGCENLPKFIYISNRFCIFRMSARYLIHPKM